MSWNERHHPDGRPKRNVWDAHGAYAFEHRQADYEADLRIARERERWLNDRTNPNHRYGRHDAFVGQGRAPCNDCGATIALAGGGEPLSTVLRHNDFHAWIDNPPPDAHLYIKRRCDRCLGWLMPAGRNYGFCRPCNAERQL